MSTLKCSECNKLTVETCPECSTIPLCETCREEFGVCDECDDTNDDDAEEGPDDGEDDEDDDQGE